MNFKELLAITRLPSMAKAQLPNVISEKTQKKLLKRSDAEEIIISAIEDINHGSIETVENLVLKKMEQGAGEI